MAAGRVKSISGEADGASAVAHELDTSATYSTSGAKLLSVKNATTEKFAIDKDGNMTISGTIPGAALNPTWSTYTPTVTATGAGTPPQYTTNIGYYMQIGKIMFVEVKLSGDGGNEGSGVDQLQVAIPAASATGHHMGY